jgi:hypothetical protein
MPTEYFRQKLHPFRFNAASQPGPLQASGPAALGHQQSLANGNLLAYRRDRKPITRNW